MQSETRWRSLLKAISWRLIATATTSILVLAFSGQWKLALSIGSLEAVSKFVLYFLHERAWAHIPGGLDGRQAAPGTASIRPGILKG